MLLIHETHRGRHALADARWRSRAGREPARSRPPASSTRRRACASSSTRRRAADPRRRADLALAGRAATSRPTTSSSSRLAARPDVAPAAPTAMEQETLLGLRLVVDRRPCGGPPRSIEPPDLADLLERLGSRPDPRSLARDMRTAIDELLTAPFRMPRLVVRRESGLDAYESVLNRAGFDLIAGADEAGRGACAGPLVVAACVLGRGARQRVDGLADSKVLTAATRERLYDEIVDRALALRRRRRAGGRGRCLRAARGQPGRHAARARPALAAPVLCLDRRVPGARAGGPLDRDLEGRRGRRPASRPRRSWPRSPATGS